MKERLILNALKQMILDEINQSTGMKPQKTLFFMIFCKFIPHKGNFGWKVPLKVIFTFYLKHQKYIFCAPIFHPLSETDSLIIKKMIQDLHISTAQRICQDT